MGIEVTKHPLKRNPSVEVLRCLLMFMIVLYHGCNNGPYSVPGRGNVLIKLVPWLLFFCTNSFMFISGWYGIRFSWKRLAKLLGMGLFAAAVLWLISKPVTGEWHWQFSLGWFGNSYLAVMLLAPIVNQGLESLLKNSKKSLLMAWGVSALAIFVSWLPIGLTVPGWGGHSFSTMLFVYVSARVLRLVDIEQYMSTRTATLMFLVALAVHLARLIPIVMFPSVKELFISTGDYDAPEVLVMGAAFFLMCYRIQFSPWVNKVAAFIAPSMFVVYLLHNGCSSVGSCGYNKLILKIASILSFAEPWASFSAVVLGALLIFALCIAIDLLRRLFLRAF